MGPLGCDLPSTQKEEEEEEEEEMSIVGFARAEVSDEQRMTDGRVVARIVVVSNRRRLHPSSSQAEVIRPCLHLSPLPLPPPPPPPPCRVCNIEMIIINSQSCIACRTDYSRKERENWVRLTSWGLRLGDGQCCAVVVSKKKSGRGGCAGTEGLM